MNDNKSLEQQLEDAARKPPVNVRPTIDLVDEVVVSQGILGLFHFIKEKPQTTEILFLNNLDLFNLGGKSGMPYLYLGSEVKEDTGTPKFLENIIISNRAIRSLAASSLMNEFGMTKKELETAGRDILDAIVYTLVTLFRISPVLNQLVTADEFDFQILRESIKDYTNIIKEEQIQEIITGLLKQSKDPELMNALTRLIRILFIRIIKHPIEFFALAKLEQDTSILEHHKTSFKIVSSLLEKTDMSLEDYIDLLDRLFLDGLIRIISSVFWCENCFSDKIGYFELHGQILPSKMAKWKCPHCGKKGSYSAVYALDRLLLDCIFSRDGLLGVYFAWRLMNEGIQFESGVTIHGQEFDFIVDNLLIECKMFQFPGRESTNRENMEYVLNRLRNMVDVLAQDNRQIEYALLLWNQYIDHDFIDEVSVKYNDFIQQYKFNIFTYDSIDEIIQIINS